MKFALNGALTIGTDDGANVEIRELVGDDNFFLFGMSEPEAAALQASGYRPGDFYESDPELKAALDLIASGFFTDGAKDGVVASLFASWTERDRFMALADFRSYVDAQQRVDAAYADQEAWSRSAVLNVARTGFFSSDRSIRDYLDRIWKAKPISQNGNSLT
jgi:starch phosphorylase